MAPLAFGLIGSGYMGRAHAIALHAVGAAFPDIEAPVCELLADTDQDRALAAAKSMGFRRATADWRELVADPRVEIVDICTPNHTHREMALAAIAAGKHVYCEKPLALTAPESRELAQAARAAGVHHMVGFNYICNPMIQTARDMIASGEIGDVTSFHGEYHEDYMSDAAAPYTWRCQRRLAGAGALADLGSHLINMAHYLIGDIARVCASLQTVHTHRIDRGSAQRCAVENEDVAHALLEFDNAVTGAISISRIATGRKCGLGWRIFGTRGSLAFDQERMNELHVYAADDPPGRRGFRTVLAAPEHPDYGAFCPAPGHGLGINDLKIIEIHNLIRAVATGKPAWPDFYEGWRVQRVMDAIELSHAQRGWIDVRDDAVNGSGS